MILYRIKIWFQVLFTLIATFTGIRCNVMSAEETVENLKKGKSLIRFGDGEFGIYQGKDIHYQVYSMELEKKFIEIKKSFEIEDEECPYILAVPKKFMTVSGFTLMKKRVYVSCWSQARYYFKKNFRHDIKYGEAFLFEKRNKNIYSQIWKHELCPHNVVFVHNSEQYAHDFAKIYNKNVMFIQCPPFNAFEVLENIEEKIMNIITNEKLRQDQVMLTISAGPAGKVLVYNFSRRGYWCIDAGHCWDDPLEGI